MRLAFALSDLPRLLVVVLSAAIAVLVLAFSLSVAMMATRPLQQLQEALEYGSVVQYGAVQSPPPAVPIDSAAPELSDVGYATQLYLTETGNGVPVNRTADVLAVDPSFSAIRVTSSDGASLFESLTEEGIIVSAKLAADVNLAVGDTVHVRPQAQPERRYTVVGINPIDMDTRFYVGSASLPTIVLHAQAGSYTSWFAPVGAHPTSDASTTATTRSAIVVRAAAALSASLALVPVLVTIGIVLACGVLFLIAYLNVFDNGRERALLDQLGYEPRHASRLVINVYGGFLVAGAVAGAIATPLLLMRLSTLVSSASQYRLVLATDLVQLAAIIALVASLAQVTQFLVLPWVRRVPPAAMSYS